MMATAPAPELLLDHRGNLRPRYEMALSYEQARLGMAFHEAGHAVLSMAYGMHVLTSEVIAWSPEIDRWSLTGNTAFEVDDTNPWRFAAQAAAGEIAHVQYLMTCGLWTPERAYACTADHDREQAIDVLAQFGYRLGRDCVPQDGKSWGMVRGMARRKVGLLWREIRTVAHAMNEHTKLTGDEIAALTGLVNAPLVGGTA
ncbi:hypothetical protein J7E96_18155 [Streptomyces sp. ISL-96]|uniref:hypothetical protein n=1 Tax=Streptomyces sp. ISL-96 TaxID=2819191 RepID=UPI001BE6DCD2|nr:hypothetical protein [Streptomyces sp. ISL-96]MBT2490407.1 hypothetical protein [Streptomyces sp. ISL-96]